MADELDPTTPGARFPYGAAAFCAACIAAAVWTFVLYSYAWHAGFADLRYGDDWSAHPLLGRYVALREEEGRWAHAELAVVLDNLSQVVQEPAPDYIVPIRGLLGGRPPAIIRGRVLLTSSISSVSLRPSALVIDAAASRWTGASVSGLVVGAMGCLIFALHLRRWLRVRRLGAEGVPSAGEGSAA